MRVADVDQVAIAGDRGELLEPRVVHHHRSYALEFAALSADPGPLVSTQW
jgi:hypothetical protein